MESFIVVTYDITDDRRRTKVAKIMCGFGDRVQYSVFECNLSETNFKRMRKRLEPLVKEGDTIRYYTLCGRCSGNILIDGSGKVTRDPAFYIA